MEPELQKASPPPQPGPPAKPSPFPAPTSEQLAASGGRTLQAVFYSAAVLVLLALFFARPDAAAHAGRRDRANRQSGEEGRAAGFVDPSALAGVLEKSNGRVAGVPSPGGKGSLDGFSLESVGSAGSTVRERATFTKGNVSLEFVVQASPDAPRSGDGNDYARVVLSAVLAGAENEIRDSVNAVVLGGSYNTVSRANNVAVLAAEGLAVEGGDSPAARAGYVRDTLYATSLQLTSGLRIKEAVLAPFRASEKLEGDHGAHSASSFWSAPAPKAVRVETGAADYLVLVDPAKETEESGLRDVERLEVVLPPHVEGAPNQQLIVQLAEKASPRGGSGATVGLAAAPRGDKVPTFVTCHRNPAKEKIAYAEAAAAWVASEASAKGAAATDAYGVYVRCVQDPRKESIVRYRRETVTISTPKTDGVAVELPVFVQEIALGPASRTSVWLVWSTYADAWIPLDGGGPAP